LPKYARRAIYLRHAVPDTAFIEARTHRKEATGMYIGGGLLVLILIIILLILIF
jgi:hypothetical protein